MSLSGSYLDRDEFAALSTAPTSLIAGDFLDPSGTWDAPHEAKRAAWRAFVDAQLVAESAKMNARLSKRYAVPFDASAAPQILRTWLAAVVTPLVYRKRGIDPSDEQIASAEKAADDARTEMREAADSETGLYEIPLRADNATSAVSRGGPFGYSEASPYEWLDVQREAVRG